MRKLSFRSINMMKKAAETVDDNLRYILIEPKIREAMPKWVSKLSKKRQRELTESWYKFYRHFELL